jgi:hypothetical protein
MQLRRPSKILILALVFIATLLLCIGLFSQTRTNDAYQLGWLNHNTRGGGAAGLLPDGTVPLTANWNVGAFTLTALNLTAAPTMGAEIDTGFASWTAAAGWTYGSTKWTHSSGTTALADTQSAVFDITKTYKIVVTYTWAGAGSTFTVAAGGQTWAAISSAAASTVTYILFPSATTRLTITPTTGFTGSIDSYSVMETTNGAIGNGAFTMGMGQLLAPIGNVAHPSRAYTLFPTTGEYYDVTNAAIAWTVGGTKVGHIGPSGFYVPGGRIDLYTGNKMILSFDADYVFKLGVSAASPIVYTITGGATTANNTNGAKMIYASGKGKGTGYGEAAIGISRAGAAGSTTNVLTDGLLVSGAPGTPVTHFGDHGQSTVDKIIETEITSFSGATMTWSNCIPAGATVFSVTTRVTTILAGAGLTSFAVGDGTDADRWGATLNIAAGSTSDGSNATITSIPCYPALTSVVITANGGNFTSGALRVSLHIRYSTAPTT